LPLSELSRLDFAEPDRSRFPVLDLCDEVMRSGGTAGAVFNAANEAAVEAFRQGELPFSRIDELTAEVTRRHTPRSIATLADVIDADSEAREAMAAAMSRIA
ncbi:MAG: 1-deoxy-D-xylulose-5-phosphate reductoisomerase, partial [Planctomycetota bacterium]